MENICSERQEEALRLSSVWIFFIASLLHFGYSSTGFFPLSFISSVNESVWEHTKIVFFAALFYDIFLYFRYFKSNHNFVAGLAPSLASIIVTIPFLFYGYSGILGFNVLAIDLLITFLAGWIAQNILMRYSCSPKNYKEYKIFSLLFVAAMVILFVVFTWYPPNLPLFTSP